MNRITIDPSKEIDTYASDLEPFAAALRSGELVAIPTETVYGLAADATSGTACAKIFEAKGRPSFNPLISHVASLEAAIRQGVFSSSALKLANAFWPGPLTLVVPKRPDSSISDLATAGLQTVALRVPAAPVMRLMSEMAGVPIAAPSANRSGRISTTSAEDVIEDLGDRIRHVIDAGQCDIGVESTIVSLADGNPLLLRPGGISREEIEAVLGSKLRLPSSPNDDHSPAAPGMLTSHYAPSATLRLNAEQVYPEEALLAFGPVSLPGSDLAKAVSNLSESGDLREAAANLFKCMRELDQSVAAKICATPIPDDGIGEAINDRLKRAAAPRPQNN